MNHKIHAVLLILFAAMCCFPAFSQDATDFAYYRLGIKYKKDKKYDKAIESFRKVLAVYPDNFNSYYQIAEIRVEEGKPSLAAYELKKALEYHNQCGPMRSIFWQNVMKTAAVSKKRLLNGGDLSK